jgi:hypothetical protein
MICGVVWNFAAMVSIFSRALVILCAVHDDSACRPLSQVFLEFFRIALRQQDLGRAAAGDDRAVELRIQCLEFVHRQFGQLRCQLDVDVARFCNADEVGLVIYLLASVML